jgi:outer membrane protein OmpA-like peptidoglycan-associated protein
MRKFLLLGSVLVLFAGCSQTGQPTNTGSGAALGALAGAGIGQIVGGDTEATLIGAGVGALAGAGIGNYLDKQEAELRQSLATTDVEVVRVGDEIRLVMPSDVTFAVNSSSVSPQFYGPIQNVGNILAKYNQTAVLVEGHTDNTGGYALNQSLSARRAQSVASLLAGRGVGYNRMSIIGHGYSQSKASNATDSGRSINRRVEIKIRGQAAG